MSIRPGEYRAKRLPSAKVLEEYLEVGEEGYYLKRTVQYDYEDGYDDSFLKATTIVTFSITIEQAQKWLGVQSLPDNAISLGTPDEL